MFTATWEQKDTQLAYKMLVWKFSFWFLFELMSPNSIISWYITPPCILISGWSQNTHYSKSNSSFSIMIHIPHSQNHSQTHVLYFFRPWSFYLNWTLKVSCIDNDQGKERMDHFKLLCPVKSHTVKISQLSFKLLQLTAKSMESKTEIDLAMGHSHLL